MSFTALDWIAVGVYFIVLLGIAVWVDRHRLFLSRTPRGAVILGLVLSVMAHFPGCQSATFPRELVAAHGTEPS